MFGATGVVRLGFFLSSEVRRLIPDSFSLEAFRQEKLLLQIAIIMKFEDFTDLLYLTSELVLKM